jgi:hypothetical protein
MKPIRFYAGVFLVTASVMMLQIIQTRILSVVMWYYLAFLVISLAMFGITAGTVWIYLRRDRFSEATLGYDLTWFTSALAVATAVCCAIEMTLAPAATGKLAAVLVWFEFAGCLAVPFFLSGVVVSLALTRSPYPIGRVYGVDLVGAAAGCLGAFALLNLTDGPSAVFWVAAVSALAAVCFSGSGLGDPPAQAMPFARQLLRVKPIFLLLSLGAFVNGTINIGFQPIFVKGKLETAADAPIFTKWNTFSRVAVFALGQQAPILYGPSPEFNPNGWSIEQRVMNIDGDAATYSYRWDGDVAKAAFLRYDVTNLAHFLPGHQRAAVIGVGAGRDLLSARVFGVPDITGIELNPIFVQLLTRDPGFADFSQLGQLPGLHLHIDEARSWFTRSNEKFDLIQMSLVDTWAATGAGAFTLSENGLYTVEAWQLFFDHLTKHGVFTVSRWYAPDSINETGRAVSLAVATLLDLGKSDPRQHIYLAAAGHIANLIVSRTPLSPQDVSRLDNVADEMKYQILLSPDRPSASPVLGGIVAARSTSDLLANIADQQFDLSPPTDERPFFFNQLPLYNPWRALKLAWFHSRAPGAVSGNIAATTTLVLLFAISLILVRRTILTPLRPAIGDVGRRLALGGSAYFMLIGVGFMCAEIGLLQRMSVFLGHPIYSLCIVLFSLVLATGIGSLLSDWLPLATRASFVMWALATAGYLGALPFWLPVPMLDFASATLLPRAAMCILAIAPAGLLMGYGFPTGMRFISAVNRTPTPWFWGINGAASVLASSLAIGLSLAFGIDATMLVSAFCYTLLIPAGIAIGFHRATAPLSVAA